MEYRSSCDRSGRCSSRTPPEESSGSGGDARRPRSLDAGAPPGTARVLLLGEQAGEGLLEGLALLRGRLGPPVQVHLREPKGARPAPIGSGMRRAAPRARRHARARRTRDRRGGVVGAAADPDRRPRGRDGTVRDRIQAAGPLTRAALAGADRVHGRAAHHRPAGPASADAGARSRARPRRRPARLGATRACRGASRRLAPPARFGSEVVARLLGSLQPPEQPRRPRAAPGDPATRAEAAVLLREAPELSPGRRPRPKHAPTTSTCRSSPTGSGVLTRTVSFVGFPYVWGGTSERTDALRRHLARRLRLLRLRLEDLPARALFGRAPA